MRNDLETFAKHENVIRQNQLNTLISSSELCLLKNGKNIAL